MMARILKRRTKCAVRGIAFTGEAAKMAGALRTVIVEVDACPLKKKRKNDKPEHTVKIGCLSAESPVVIKYFKEGRSRNEVCTVRHKPERPAKIKHLSAEDSVANYMYQKGQEQKPYSAKYITTGPVYPDSNPAVAAAFRWRRSA